MNTKQSNSKASHTPGPWEVAEESGIVYASMDQGAEEPGICATQSPGMANLPFENAIANARLIAAAPDLLEALISVANLLHNDDPTIEDQDRVLNQVVKVIAKAKGE